MSASAIRSAVHRREQDSRSAPTISRTSSPNGSPNSRRSTRTWPGCSATPWRPSAGSTWPTTSTSPSAAMPSRPVIEVELNDAWVWDMYRKSRFVPKVKVLTFKDVNVEELPLDRDLTAAHPAPGWPTSPVVLGRARGGAVGTSTVATASSSQQLALRGTASSTSSCASPTRSCSARSRPVPTTRSVAAQPRSGGPSSAGCAVSVQRGWRRRGCTASTCASTSPP